MRDARIVAMTVTPQSRSCCVCVGSLERAKGIEPSYAAWEAAVLPLNYARNAAIYLRFLSDGAFLYRAGSPGSSLVRQAPSMSC